MSPELERHGRGAQTDPPNRFEVVHAERDWEQLAEDDSADERPVKTRFLVDHSRSIVSENGSPDIPFRYSVNPYRGCEHDCAYCYARPTHEYLGFNAGLDFESRILVKERAPELLRDWLARARSSQPSTSEVLRQVEERLQRDIQEIDAVDRQFGVTLRTRQLWTAIKGK